MPESNSPSPAVFSFSEAARELAAVGAGVAPGARELAGVGAGVAPGAPVPDSAAGVAPAAAAAAGEFAPPSPCACMTLTCCKTARRLD